MNDWIDALVNCLMAVFIAYQMADIANTIGLRWFLISLLGVVAFAWWTAYCFSLIGRAA